MAKVIYKSYTQNDNLLFPPSLGDFIAENDPVRVLNTIVDHLDLSKIEAMKEQQNTIQGLAQAQIVYFRQMFMDKPCPTGKLSDNNRSKSA